VKLDVLSLNLVKEHGEKVREQSKKKIVVVGFG
jgi:hypothetical protein